ncbi:MAG: cation transporter [Eubacteriales bacterium]|nr:cation transporter [Eubacteriales bacterium]
MKKSFKLKGLDCANCASKIEDRINKLEGVVSATLNFMTTKLTIEANDDKMESIIEASRDIIKKYEPHVEMQKA